MRIATLLSTALLAASVQAQETAPSPPRPPAPPDCKAPEHRQFDFWIGEWNVPAPDGKPPGHSRIESILDGCVILENWQGGSGYTGKSFNIYNRDTGRWEQFWVDTTGGRLHLIGGIVDGKMVLEGVQAKPNAQTGKTQRERITWTPNADGTVRQHWETSIDDGKTWNTSFDGLYQRVKAPSP
ncbi:hypothetical protein [Arenimonas sp.]|uniref:hypothetical protein n=1 Tax=Arenimonas sp. TaxID=1872635 RepID=UPI0039E29076